MLNALRRLRANWAARAEIGQLQQWAEGHGLELRRARGIQGCVLEGRMAGHAGRIEWGPSQRNYVQGLELRLLAQATTPDGVLALVLNRELQEAMESAVYQQFVGDLQTRVDADAPPEMRWLVMLDRLQPGHLGALKERYAAFGNQPDWLERWLSTPLNDALAATMEVLPAGQPVVLSARDGRLLLRTAMPAVDLRLLSQCLSVFEHAAREARRMDLHAGPVVFAGPQTLPATWSPDVATGEATEWTGDLAVGLTDPRAGSAAVDLTLPEGVAASNAAPARAGGLPSGVESASAS